MIAVTGVIRDAVTLVRSQTVTEFDVVPKEDGWNVYAISPDRTTLVSVVIRPSALGTPEDPYVPPAQDDPEHPDPVFGRFTVDCDTLLKALKPMGAKVDIDISGGRMTLRGDGLTMRVPLLAPLNGVPRFPQGRPTSSAIIGSDQLARIIKADEDCQAVLVKVGAGGLHIGLVADDGTEKATLDIAADDCGDLRGEARAKYSYTKFRSVVGALPKDTLLTLDLADDFPLYVTASDNDIVMKWLAAPWVEAE